MVFENHIAAEHLPIDCRCLLDDAGVRDGDDHAVQLMLESVTKGKRHRRSGLAAAGWHCQAIETLWLVGSLDARLVNLTPHLVDAAAIRRKSRLILIKPCPSFVKGRSSAAQASDSRTEVALRG